MHTICLPLSIPVSGKTNFALNMNQYRNAHHMTLNKAKVMFKELVSPLVSALPVMERVKLTYTVFPKTAQLFDIGNVCCVVDKFFSDALVELGRLPDDNYRYLAQIDYRFGAIDRENPRVEVTIEDHTPMKLSLNEAELHAAAVAWVQTLGILAPGVEATVTLTGGGTGKNNEYGADVEFNYVKQPDLSQKVEVPAQALKREPEAPKVDSAPAPGNAEAAAPVANVSKPADATQASSAEPDLTAQNEENNAFATAAEAGKPQTGASLFNRPA